MVLLFQDLKRKTVAFITCKTGTFDASRVDNLDSNNYLSYVVLSMFALRQRRKGKIFAMVILL